jgi:glycosyltransferase involved in cell wall biosynthesis
MPDEAPLEFVMVSFEGPDVYAQAGGLGVRARELCRALAAAGHPTSLVFVGDPDRPGQEVDHGVRLYRWAQHISARTRAGVYQGEEEKIADLQTWLPPFLVDTVVAPAADRGARVVVLAEEWHTAEFCVTLDATLRQRGLRQHCALLWNANNVFGFDRIDWVRLRSAATVTTVSRYMKHLMWPRGVNPLVIPNGIPVEALDPVSPRDVQALREAAESPCLAVKIGRFSPDKRWHQAVGSIARLREHGVPARMLIRGGIEPFGGEVLAHARSLGLSVTGWNERVADVGGIARALRATDAVVIDLQTFLPDGVIPPMYAAADGVLANSGHEPFGLVGLEAMASGGVAFVGATGEEYAEPFKNAMVIETDDAAEIVAYVTHLAEHPETARNLRIAAQRTARDYTWQRVIDILLQRLEYVAIKQGLKVGADTPPPASPDVALRG